MTTTPPKPASAPPPPDYAPTVGRVTTWWRNTADTVWHPDAVTRVEDSSRGITDAMNALARTITETPEQRRHRERIADDDRREAAGETPKQRRRRHQAEDRRRRAIRQRLDSLPWNRDPAERVRRFRRWCVMTALSATAGTTVATFLDGDQGLAVLTLVLGYGADLWSRHLGAVAVSDVTMRQPVRLLLVLLIRMPFAAALASLCHVSPLIAAAIRIVTT